MNEKERSNGGVKEENLGSVMVTDASVDVELAAALLQVKKSSHGIDLGQQPLELTRSNHHLDALVSQRDAALRALAREKWYAFDWIMFIYLTLKVVCRSYMFNLTFWLRQ